MEATEQVPIWLEMIGIAGGFLFGLAGMVMGYIAMRRTHRNLLTDMRREATRLIAQLEPLSDEVGKMLPDVQKRRHSVLNAKGQYRSGARELFDNEHAEKSITHADVVDRFNALFSGNDLSGHNQKMLEVALAELHGMHSKLKNLDGWLRENMEEDKRWSEERMKAAEARYAAPSRD